MPVVECDWCGIEFETPNDKYERNQHHFCCRSHWHEWHRAKRPVVNCDQCGAKIRRPRSHVEKVRHQFCNQECYGKWRSTHIVGTDSPLWDKTEVTCDNCGDDIWVTPYESSLVEHHFCDQKCYGEWRSSLTGEDHPLWNRVELTCDNCGCPIVRKPSQAERSENHFCSTECHGEWATENRTGENSPTWKGGYEPYYGGNWFRRRRLALDRDAHTCQDCGATVDELGQEPDVHHIRPFRLFVAEHGNDVEAAAEHANGLDNLICYCRSCHLSIEHQVNGPRSNSDKAARPDFLEPCVAMKQQRAPSVPKEVHYHPQDRSAPAVRSL
jgi:hypothetical protein